MVRWQGVMLRRLIVTLLLAAIASSSSSSSSSGHEKNKNNSINNGTTCPESCRCIRMQAVDAIDNNNNNNNNSNENFIVNRKKSMEIRCNGKMPDIELLRNNIRRLVVESTNPREITNALTALDDETIGNDETGNGGKSPDRKKIIQLREIALVNCSLTSLTVSLKYFMEIFVNLSGNNFSTMTKLRMKNGERLRGLDMSHNRLSRLTKIDFANYTKLSILNLRRNAIEAIEQLSFAKLKNLETLDISENRVVTLSDGIFGNLCMLQKLNLSGNKMAGVLGGGHQWFDGLVGLKELDVSRNERTIAGGHVTRVGNGGGHEISGISNETRNATKTSVESFVALEALPVGLKILRLAENRLTDVELSLILGSGRRLEIVDASRIGLERVPSALTRSVQSLTLSGNLITNIRSGDFDSYPLLRLVDLSYNLINNVEDDAFGRLENLEKLDLSNNRLISIPQSLPASLLHLILSRNSIGRLNAKDLQGVCRLRTLVANLNAITDIDVDSMSQLGVLEFLDISDNPIKQLPANTFSGPRSLSKLRMSGLTSLEWDREKPADMAFPVPAPERIVDLDLSRSPALAAQLLADEAALSACKSLRRLNLALNDLTSLRNDLAYLLPQLHTLGLSGNPWNCSRNNRDDIVWLADWLRHHEETEPRGRCVIDGSFDIVDSDDDLLCRLTSSSFKIVDEKIIEVGSTRESSLGIHVNRSDESTTESLRNDAKSVNSIFDEIREKDYTDRLKIFVQNSTTKNPSITINESTSSRIVTGGNDVTDVEGTTKMEPAIAIVDPTISVSRATLTMPITNDRVEDSKNSTSRLINDDAGDNDLSSKTSRDIVEIAEIDGFDDNAERINDTTIEDTIVSEQSTKSLSRTSDTDVNGFATHPGMFVIVGAVLGTIVALSVVLSRRATIGNSSGWQNVVLIDHDDIRDSENFQTGSYGNRQRNQPIVPELW